MPTAAEIEHALDVVSAAGTREVFLQRFLIETLHWPIDLAAKTIEDAGADHKIRQIQTNPVAPWGIFLIELACQRPCIADGGMTEPFRRTLRALVEKKRDNPNACPVWKREQLLFICTHNYQQFRFAYFNAAEGQTKTASLATFGFGGEVPPGPACAHNLPHLQWPKDFTPAAFTAAWPEAFNVDRVTKQFFNNYREVFAACESAIAKNNPIKGQKLRRCTQSLFNRLLFLRFIEHKGCRTWHPNPADEPDLVSTPIVDFAKSLFDRYNFTAKESTPLDIEVAVDPEMLGKIFEELVTGRPESGSYYTPRPVVSFMCREALKGYLTSATECSTETVASFIERHETTSLTESHARQIITALDNLKALDPACGAGAFLLGLLHELLALYRLLYREKIPQDSRSIHELKRRIISHNLHGVDLDPFAANIAILRLSLSLAADSVPPEPSPNVEFNIKTGDSLLGPNPQNTPGRRGPNPRSRKNAIDWGTEFSAAFEDNHGFDIVLANPPYINSRDMARSNPKRRKIISEMYEMTRGSWDIYIAFYERAFQLLAPSGVLSFITPDKWISKPFGEELRKRTTDKIAGILKFGRDVFDSANVDAIVTVHRNFPQTHLAVYNFTPAGARLKQMVPKEKIKAPFTYDWLFSEHLPLLEKIEAHPRRFSELAMCENACATDDAYRLQEFIHEQPENHSANEMLMVNTGTIGKYVSRWGSRKMTYLGKQFLRPAINREPFLRAFPKSYGQKSCRKKLIVKGLNLLDACLDAHGNIIPGIPTLIVADDDLQKLKLLLAFINSPVAIFYIRQKYAGSSYNGGIAFTRQMINDLPIPPLTSADQQQLISLVDQIIAAKTHHPAADTSSLELDLNRRIHTLYGLEPGA